ncbi:MAG: TIGR03621 family F420-dependent LLM class oxidoreductase [Actinomycetota bacterium]
MSHPFRFSVQAFTPSSASEWTDQARAAEDLGYSCLHLADHYLGPGEAATAASHPPQVVAAIPAMMAAAAVTSTIKVGARVMCCDYHQPVVLAKSLATVDFLSEGRLEAGFGAGWITSEYEAMGVAMDGPGVRIDRMIEYVELAKAYFAGADLDQQGDHVHVSNMGAIPASPQPGGPKIMIGGGSPRVLRTAGAMADVVSINFDNSAGKIGARGIGSGTADGTKQKVDWIREGAGDRFDEIEIEIGAYFTAVTDDTAATLEQMAGAMGMPPDMLAEHPHALVGSVDEICDILQDRRERYGISYVNVAVRNMHAFAPVVERLAGT